MSSCWENYYENLFEISSLKMIKVIILQEVGIGFTQNFKGLRLLVAEKNVTKNVVTDAHTHTHAHTHRQTDRQTDTQG